MKEEEDMDNILEEIYNKLQEKYGYLDKFILIDPSWDGIKQFKARNI